MSGFWLAPADEGGVPVALPPGETVIGRGAWLGITDKRVSRNHAILKVTGDQLSIKPVHVNPCFYRSAPNSELLPLDSDKWHQLKPGDNIALLVNKYVFRILFSPDEKQLREECDFCTEDTPNHTPSTLQLTGMSHRDLSQPQTPSSSRGQCLEKTDEIPKKTSDTIPENQEPKPAQRKRILPVWMLQEDLRVQSPLASVPARERTKDIKEPKRKRKITENEDPAFVNKEMKRTSSEPVVREMEKNESYLALQTAEVSAGQFHLQDEELKVSSNGQTCQPGDTDATSTRESKTEKVSSKHEQDNWEKSSQSPVHQDEIEDLTPTQVNEIDISDLAESQDTSQSSSATSHQRTACRYGKNCYRKNPIHFQQFSHPGDSDYQDPESVSQDEDDNRPECPYGTSCYRKNPQHKLEYKHTKPPESERRRLRPKAVKKGRSVLDDDSDNNGESNEYDLNDSFIDDEEEEECDPTDEDSDWEPDFQDEDDEDVDTLLQEAKKFVKTKK
uniref:Aprataxin and PNKP like factor n=1 Tax=Salvator merianae TaxID=96440 RepID=A0A8D0BCF7_SALMN